MKRTLKVLILFTMSATLSPTAVQADAWVSKPAPKPARVLVLGDSVFHAFAHIESATQIMNERQSTIFATQGCQRLVGEGCLRFTKLGALQQLRRHAGKFSDVVVIGTGYNDRLGPEFKAAVVAITNEARTQGVEVLWVTYREVRHVRGKAGVMNEQLRRFDTKIDNLHVADWNTFSKDAKSWFRSDRLHLIAPGADALARLLNSSLEPILAARDAVTAGG